MVDDNSTPPLRRQLPSRRPSLSVVVLCYRSGQRAEAFVSRLQEALEADDIDYELILVGNYVPGTAETDPTPDVVRSLAEADHRIVCSAIPKRGWMGWDVRCGLELGTGDFLGIIDGDGQVLVSELPQLYALIRRGEHDLVKTYRVERGDGLHRKLLSHVFNGLFHLLFPGVHARDINSKPKLMTRAAYDAMDLRSDDWFIDAEIMLAARRNRLRIGEISSQFLGLSGRRSFVGPAAVFEFLVNLARYRWREWRR